VPVRRRPASVRRPVRRDHVTLALASLRIGLGARVGGGARGRLAPAGEPPGGVGAIATSSAPHDPCRAPRALATLASRCTERPRGWGGIQRGSGVALWRRGGPSLKASVAERVYTRDVNAYFILNSGRRRFSPAAPSVATSTSTGRLRSSRGFCSRSFDRANPVRCRRHMRARPPVAVCRD
jgi:hypothetical protein